MSKGTQEKAIATRRIKSAVITGPTGAVGTALCEILAKNKVEVYAVVRPGSGRAARLGNVAGIRMVSCDASELQSLSQKLAGVRADAFFHLAWAKTVGQGRNDMPAQIENIRYTIDAVRSAAALGCRVFLGAGSQAEYGRVDHALTPETPCFPENGYGMAKLCAGEMSREECRRLGVEYIWPRILSVYGPRDGESSMISSVTRALLKGEKPALTAGEQIWDFLYSADAAEALYRLALSGSDGEVYPLGSGSSRPLREYIEMLRDAIDPALPLGFGEVPYGDRQVMHLEADLTALARDTGYTPATDFAEGIRKTIDWMRESHGE